MDTELAGTFGKGKQDSCLDIFDFSIITGLSHPAMN